MPITKSAKKSLRVSLKKRAQNQEKKIALSKALKSVSEKNVNKVISLIDKAAKANLFHANKAARMKSALAKKFGSPKAETKVETKKEATKAKPAKKTTAKPTAKKPAVKKAVKAKKTTKA